MDFQDLGKQMVSEPITAVPPVNSIHSQLLHRFERMEARMAEGMDLLIESQILLVDKVESMETTMNNLKGLLFPVDPWEEKS